MLVKKPNASSVVWNYFGLEAKESGIPKEHKPVCCTCKRSVPTKGGNTSNLMSHLKEHHAELYIEALSAQKTQQSKGKTQRKSDNKDLATRTESSSEINNTTIKDILLASRKYGPKSSQALELNKSVAFFIAKDCQPLSIVERPGFRRVLNKLHSKYEVPSRKHFIEYEIPRLYGEVKEKVISKLKEAHYFSVTTDFWTSISHIPFMSFTVHFVDSEWVLRSYCLDTLPSYEDHTGENIAAALQDILENWNLSTEKLIATTTDNGSNYIAAFNSLGWTRVSCFGHNLNLAVTKAAESHRMRHAIGTCHTIIELFSRSWKKTRDLRLKQEQLRRFA